MHSTQGLSRANGKYHGQSYGTHSGQNTLKISRRDGENRSGFLTVKTDFDMAIEERHTDWLIFCWNKKVAHIAEMVQI